jgi:hypothetical protein
MRGMVVFTGVLFLLAWLECQAVTIAPAMEMWRWIASNVIALLAGIAFGVAICIRPTVKRPLPSESTISLPASATVAYFAVIGNLGQLHGSTTASVVSHSWIIF